MRDPGIHSARKAVEAEKMQRFGQAAKFWKDAACQSADPEMAQRRMDHMIVCDMQYTRRLLELNGR